MHTNHFYHSRKFDSNSVVRVRAQVMMRDDSTGGWLPMGGGGLSNVSVRKRKIQHEDDQPCKHEYLIYGKRNSDQTVVLSCTIKKDFEYNKVMPTFHHWKTGNKKFGLTFQTAADARAFDKGVRLAIEDLLDGMSESSPLHQYNLDVGDDDVFMQLHLPVEKNENGSNGLIATSSSIAGGGDNSPVPPPHLFIPPPPRLGSFHQSKPLSESSPETFIQTDQTTSAKQQPIIQSKDYSYVKFPYRETSQQQTEYSKTDGHRRDSISSLKKSFIISESGGGPLKKTSSSSSSSPSGSSSSSSAALSSTSKKKKLLQESSPSRVTCDRCRTSFSVESNPRGSCPEASDCVKKSIEAATCLQCAKCLLYHCMSDSEGDYLHPCDCSNVDGHWGRRWISLTLLSVLVPCLCCYVPLMGCYKCARKCRLCGGRHQPAS